MRILLLSRYDRSGASSRIRSHQYLPLLEAYGFEVTVAPLFRRDYLARLYGNQPVRWADVFGDYVRRAWKVLGARRFDLIWIEKEILPSLPAWLEQLLVLTGVPYVVDYDDAIFHRYDLSKNPLKRLLRKKIDRVMKGAAAVICGNSYLADRARNAGARSIEILPSVVDLDRYAAIMPRQRDFAVVGWIGSPSTAQYLDLLVPPLRILSAERDIQFRIIGAHFAVPGLNIDCRPWSEDTEVHEIQDIDVGVMPLRDSPWEAGKCGYKLIQYMACGVASIGSPVGMNREIIVDGVNGFLASTLEDWTHTIRRLLTNRELRQSIGLQGRRTVEASYSLQLAHSRLARVLMNAASNKH